MPFKSRRKNRRKNRRKKRKIRRKEKIQSGIACGLMITKNKQPQKQILWEMYKTKPPKKKKKIVLSTQNPLAEIYIYR
jgi:hypothetical protein